MPKGSTYGYGSNNKKGNKSPKKSSPKGVQRGKAENPMGRKGKIKARSGVSYSTTTMNKQAGQRGA